MTLADLVNKARDAGMPFSAWNIPLLKDGKPFDIDFEAEGSNEEGWHIKVIEHPEEGYIRKDALLKWLEYTKKLWSQTGSSLAALQTVQMVIDKINSL